MALLAESLVEEWLNRRGFFTIRGVKHGLGEMDVIAVHHGPDGIQGWHVEVTVSFRPIGYIAPDQLGSGRRRDYVRRRTAEKVQACAHAYVEAKFRASAKAHVRERLWPGLTWCFHLVHGVLRHADELEAFAREGVTCHPFHELLSELSRRDRDSFSGSAGGDLAEIVSYYKKHGHDAT
jgi:Holliday junction resolvase-like predicted endonuclease